MLKIIVIFETIACFVLGGFSVYMGVFPAVAPWLIGSLILALGVLAYERRRNK